LIDTRQSSRHVRIEACGRDHSRDAPASADL
jgi:hypothetical protein